MKNENGNIILDQCSTASRDEYDVHSSFIRLLKDDSSTNSSGNISLIKQEKNKKYFTKLQYKSSKFIFPLFYFASSAFFLFNLLFLNIFEGEETRKNFEVMPMSPFPSFNVLKELQPNVFNAVILIISISGFINVWCFCSLLLRRFSVPELESNKLIVHLMFILGIFGNISFIFFGCSPELLTFEMNHFKHLKISLSMIIFLSFIFMNILFAAMSLVVLQNFKNQIAFNDKRLQRNIRTKKVIVHLTIFMLVLYISSIVAHYYVKTSQETTSKMKNLKYNYNNNKDYSSSLTFIIPCLSFIQFLLYIIPYFLFSLNALMNLSYYSDISYLENVIHLIIDKEFFLTNDESDLLLSNFPV